MRSVCTIMTLALMLGGCATLNPLDDTRIEAEVKARLVAEKEANLTRLGVLSNRGVVYLSGTAESAEDRTQAETVARGVRGVKRVVNALDVHAPK